MILKNLYIPWTDKKNCNIEISGKHIKNVSETIVTDFNERLIIDFGGAIAFPGLINSHDHLEFNLYPKLGNRIYKDYVEWGDDIHKNNNDIIKLIQNVPFDLRYKWGLYKNLLSGVTTVVNHGIKKLHSINYLPDVFESYKYLHSPRLEKRLKLKFLFNFNNLPIIIHVGEGTNNESFNEVNKIINLNIWKRKIFAVHGIAVEPDQAQKLKAIVWCPDSNIFLYGKTADILKLKEATNILFGTDSTVSADWNIWNHIRLARNYKYLTDFELYNCLTKSAADLWEMKGKGDISNGNLADIVISKNKSDTPVESFYNTDPEDILIVIKDGKIVLVDKTIADNNPRIKTGDLEIISVSKEKKYIIKGLGKLIREIKLFQTDINLPLEI